MGKLKAANLCTSPGVIQCAPYCEENTPAMPFYLILSGSNSREFHSVECKPFARGREPSN